MKSFKVSVDVRWSDCDSNRHVRHSAYYDYGAHSRIKYFSELGFGVKAMGRLNIGPILFKEECTFIRELHLNDTIEINILQGEMTPDCAKWQLHHEIYNGQNQKSAHITLAGAWMDLSERKLTIPPKALAEALHTLELGESYIHNKKK